MCIYILDVQMDFRAVFGISLLLNIYYLHLTSMYIYLKQKRRRVERRWWIRPINRSRSDIGYFNNQFQEAYETDHEEFFEITRMIPTQYDHLCHLVRPFLTKKSLRKPISVNERVTLTLL